MPSSKKSFTLFIAGLGCILIVFYWPFLSGQRDFFYSDSTAFFEPLCTYIGTALRQGRIPLWNDMVYCGMPQVAVGSPGLFYPPTWLFAICPYSVGLAITMVLHQLLLGIGGFLLIEALGWGVLPAIVCGATLALCGYAFGLTSNYTLITTAAWVPITCWSLYRIRASDHTAYWIRTVACAICVCMLMLGGRPEISGPCLAGLFLYAINPRASAPFPQAQYRNEVFWQLRALFIGVILSMFAVLPVIDWIPFSRRSGGLPSGEVFLFSANFYDLVAMVTGPIFGDLRLQGAFFKPLLYSANLVPYFLDAYIGPVVLTLAVWGLLDRTWRFRWMLLSVILLATLFALGSSTPVIPWLLQPLPALSIFRFPIKLLFFVIFALSILAARGTYLVVEKRHSIGWSWLIWVGFGAFALIESFGILNSVTQPQLVSAAESAIYIYTGAAVLAGATLCLAVWRMQQKNVRALGSIIVIGLVSNLIWYAVTYETLSADAGYYNSRPGLANYLKRIGAQKARVLGLYLEHLEVPMNLLEKSPDRTATLYQYDRLLLRPNTNMDFGMPSAFGDEGAMIGDYYYLLLNTYVDSSQSLRTENGTPPNDARLARFCQITATRFALTQGYRKDKDGKNAQIPFLNPRYFKLVQENKEENWRVFEVLHATPRVFLTNNVTEASSRDEVLNALLRADPADVGNVTHVILESDQDGSTHGTEQKSALPTSLRSAGLRPAPVPSSEEQLRRIETLVDVPEYLQLQIHTPKDCWLVVADQYYPGWQATIDGATANIRRANGFTRAVFVPAGDRIVDFSFRPADLGAGMLLSGLGFVLLFVLKLKESRSIPGGTSKHSTN